MSKPSKPPAFQFYAADFLADENQMVMDLAECGAYIRLMAVCWNEGSIPSDLKRMARLCGASKAEMEGMWPALAPCFEEHPSEAGRLIHPRLERERRKQAKYKQKMREAGKKGAEVRWGNDGDEPEPEPTPDELSTTPEPAETKGSHSQANSQAIARGMASDSSLFSSSSLPSGEVVTQNKEKTLPSSTFPVVEESEPTAEEKPPKMPRVTDSQLRDEAIRGLGLGRYVSVPDQAQVSRELHELLGHGIDRENLLAALRGCAALRDMGAAGFTKGQPYTPGVLIRWGRVWYGEGDQRTQRNLLDLAQEIARKPNRNRQSRDGPTPVSDVLGGLLDRGAA